MTNPPVHASTTGNGANAFALGQGGCAVAIWPSMAACGPPSCTVIGYVDAAGRWRIAVGYEDEHVEAGVAYEAGRNGRLVPAGKVLLVDDGRGYTVLVKDGVYIAGCRSFTLAEARSHWGDPTHHAPQSAAAILAAIEAHAASEAAA